MSTRDIRTSNDPDLVGSLAAIERAARRAREVAIATNTGIVISVDGRPVHISAAELIKMRELESAKPKH